MNEQIQLQEGIQAAKGGDHAKARRILQEVVEQSPNNMRAWLWLSGVVESEAEKRSCLAHVLAVDPGNEVARRGLAALLGPGSNPAPQPATPIMPSGGGLLADESFKVLGGILDELKQISRELGALRQGSGVNQPAIPEGERLPIQDLKQIAKELSHLRRDMRQSRVEGHSVEREEGIVEAEQPPLKAALFIDFDNIYIGLESLERSLAESFATDPAGWLNWIERGMPGTQTGAQAPPRKRSIIVRSCYINPKKFSQFRPYFVRSAFSVVDCPSLTRQGKTSTDIRMVMGILDTLERWDHLDEYIILSGDADFTPVLLKLRAHDCRTTIIAIGPAAEAYKASCDQVIAEESFIEGGLGISSDRPDEGRSSRRGSQISSALSKQLDAVAERIYEEASASGELLATDLLPILKESRDFRRGSDWFGFGGLRPLAQNLVKRVPELQLVDSDPWRVSVQAMRSRELVDHDELKAEIVQMVQTMVDDSEEPVAMSKVAHEVFQKLGDQIKETKWAGAGTFKSLLQGADTAGFEIVPADDKSEYFLYNPARHGSSTLAALTSEEEELDEKLATFIRRVNQVTGTPRLEPKQYRIVFEALVDDLKEHPFHINATSKSVRDLCIERGESISRANISFILKGIRYAGHHFEKNGQKDTPEKLAAIFRKQVRSLIDGAQMTLSKEDRRMINEWISVDSKSKSKKGG